MFGLSYVFFVICIVISNDVMYSVIIFWLKKKNYIKEMYVCKWICLFECYGFYIRVENWVYCIIVVLYEYLLYDVWNI